MRQTENIASAAKATAPSATESEGMGGSPCVDRAKQFRDYRAMKQKRHSDLTPQDFRAIRDRLGLSTGELARELLVTPRLIQMIEAGRVPITARLGRDLERLARDHQSASVS